MRLILHRDLGRSPDCTLGVLSVGDILLQTLERPWVESPVCKSGAKGISRVMFGIYKLMRHSSEAHPKTWALVNPDLDVLHWPDPGKPDARTAVLIHPANWVIELRGCIAPGLKREFAGSWSVRNSRDAFDRILQILPWTDEHTLEIV